MIRRKSEVTGFLEHFETYANYNGQKYYLTLETVNPKGTLTVMKNPDGNFTYHRKNQDYWDIREIKTDYDMLIDIAWGFKKSINNAIRKEKGS